MKKDQKNLFLYKNFILIFYSLSEKVVERSRKHLFYLLLPLIKVQRSLFSQFELKLVTNRKK